MNIYTAVAIIPAVITIIAFASFYNTTPRRTWINSGACVLAAFTALFFFKTGYLILIALFMITIVCLAGAALFYFSFSHTETAESGRWIGQLREIEAKKQEEEKKRNHLKREMEKSEKEVVRTLRLYGAMKGLGEGFTWDEMVPHIDYAVKQCLGLQDYQLYLLDESSNFQKVITRGFHRFHEAPLKSPSVQPKLHQTANETYLETPIRHGDVEIGLLWARVIPSNQVSKEDLLIEAMDLSEGLGMGLQKARLFSSLEKLSQIDGLTGLHRRQVFNERLNEEFRRARMFHTVFSLLLADVDHFKTINDTYGHQSGDEVLKRVAKILKENIYETDFVARYGGEEFVIIFPQTEPAGVLRKAELMRSKINRESFVLGWHKIQITISMGVAHYPKDGQDMNSLIQTADQALYTAKNWGRNKVVDSSQL